MTRRRVIEQHVRARIIPPVLFCYLPDWKYCPFVMSCIVDEAIFFFLCILKLRVMLYCMQGLHLNDCWGNKEMEAKTNNESNQFTNLC